MKITNNQGSIINKMIRIILILLIIVISIQAHNCTITLYTHKDCNNSQAALQIINKLAHQYNNTNQFNTSLLLMVDMGQQYNAEDMMVYPTIMIRLPGRQIRYQNQLSLVELEYWINVVCMSRVPVCGSWMHQPIFPIHIQYPPTAAPQHHQYMSLIDYVTNNPAIKVCNDPSLLPISNTASSYTTIHNTIEQLLHQLPIFSKLTHNIRNHLLINTESTTAVILIHNPKIPAHSTMKHIFMDVISYIRRKDPRITYHITDQARKSLIFITDTAASRMVVRLVEFLAMDIQRIRADGAIIAFRYRVSKYNTQQQILQGIQYPTQPNKPLDNKFPFWLEQLAASISNPNIHHKLFPPASPCRSNKITILHMRNNIHSTLATIAALKLMQDIGGEDDREYYGQAIFRRVMLLTACQQCNRQQINTIIGDILDNGEYAGYRISQHFEQLEIQQVRYTSNPYIKLCIADKNPIYLNSSQQLYTHLLNNNHLTTTNIINKSNHQQHNQL